MVFWFCRGNDPGNIFCSVDSDVETCYTVCHRLDVRFQESLSDGRSFTLPHVKLIPEKAVGWSC